MTFDEFISIFEAISEGKDVKIGYRLYEEIRIMLLVFGSASNVYDFLKEVQKAESPEIKD